MSSRLKVLRRVREMRKLEATTELRQAQDALALLRVKVDEVEAALDSANEAFCEPGFELEAETLKFAHQEREMLAHQVQIRRGEQLRGEQAVERALKRFLGAKAELDSLDRLEAKKKSERDLDEARREDREQMDLHARRFSPRNTYTQSLRRSVS